MRFLTTYALTGAVALVAVINSGCSTDTGPAKRAFVENGNRYVQQQKYKEAIVEYRNAVKLDPKFGEARFKLAETYLRTGEPRNAYGEAVRAADALPRNVDAQILAVKLLLWAGRFEDAKVRVQKLLTAEPRNVPAQILLGNALAGLKDFDQAVSELQEAIKLEPTKPDAYSNLAMLQAASGKQAEAEGAFKKAIEVAPQSVEARLALANYYWATRRVSEAEGTLKQALELGTKPLDVNRALAVFYMANKRRDEAEPYFKKVVDLAKDSLSRLVLADYYITGERNADALPVLETVATDPELFAAAKVRIAQIEDSTGQSVAAQKTLGQVLAKEPGNGMALAMKGRLLLAEHKLDDALAQAQLAIKSNPKSTSAHYMAGLAYDGKRDTARAEAAFNEVLKLNPRTPLAQLALARLHLIENRPKEATQLARQAVLGQPDNPAGHLLLVQSLIAQGDLQAAAPELSALLEKYPNDAAVHTRAGMLAVARKDPRSARSSFEQALRLAPSMGEAFAGLVTLDLAEGRVSEARANIDVRLRNRPDDSRLWLLSAGVFMAGRDAAGAERALRKAIEVDASNLEAYSMLGRLYFSQGKLVDARAEMERVSERNPAAALGARTMIAVILDMQHKRADAQKQYEQILATDPTAAVAANNLAWIYAEQEINLDAALQLAQVAVAKLPDAPEVNDTVGWVYLKLGLSSQAIPQFQRSMKIAPQVPDFPYHLGLAYMQEREWDQARQFLQQALKLNPHFDGADNAKEALVSIQE